MVGRRRTDDFILIAIELINQTSIIIVSNKHIPDSTITDFKYARMMSQGDDARVCVRESFFVFV